jgi:phage shock protein PspC (stress-responsive transcriptional regulator)
MNGFFAAIRRMGVTRSQDRWVGGVAGGLAARFGVDPLLVRGAIGVTMLMGFGFVLYGLAWALLPEQADGRIHLEETIRGSFDIALLGAVAMVVIGMSAGDWWFSWGPFDSGWLGGVAWVAIIGAGIVITVNALRQNKERRASAPPWQPPYPGGQPVMTSTSPYPAPGAPVPSGPGQPASPAPAAAAAPRVATGAPVPPAPPRPPYGGYGPGAPAWSGSGASVPPGRTWTPTPPPPPTPPRPPKSPRRGPGAALTGVVVAVILLGLAGLLAADYAGVYDGPIAAVVVGGGVALVGLGIIVSGLRGRTAGGLTALAIIGMVVAGPATLFGDEDRWDWDSNDRPFRSYDTTVTTRDAAENGYSFGIGNAVIDLTEVPLTDETLVVPIDGGVGDVRVIVPDGTAVTADVTSGAGNVEWLLDGTRQVSDGVGHDRRFSSEEMADARQAQIALTVDVGIGSITIEED